MTFGYMIATEQPARELLRSPLFRFHALHRAAGLIFYVWMDDSGALTARKDGTSRTTEQGEALLRRVGAPFYFVDFLLAPPEDEMDVTRHILHAIKWQDILRLPALHGVRIQINQVYRVGR